MSNGNARKLEKEKWVSIAVREEVDLLPAGVIAHLLKRLQIIEEENAELVAKLDKQAAELYAAMEELRQVKNLKNTSVPSHFTWSGRDNSSRTWTRSGTRIQLIYLM